MKITKYGFMPWLMVLLLATNTPCFASPGPKQGAAEKRLVFGFLPILSTQKLVIRFAPMTDYLAKKLGRPVKFETAPSYTEFTRRTNVEKRYDILFTAPHFYYTAQREAGYEVVVRVDGPKLAAIIVTSRTSGIESVRDLRSHKLAVPDPLSLGALLIRNHLASVGLRAGKDVELITTPSHNAALLSTFKGATDAAGLMVPPYRRAAKEIRDKMHIIATTQATPHMPISVSSRLSDSDKARIKQVLIEMRHTEEGKKLLQHLSWPGFVASSPAEYDQLEWAAKLIGQ